MSSSDQHSMSRVRADHEPNVPIALYRQVRSRSGAATEGRQLSPEDYANHVLSYSKHPFDKSLHPGDHYWNLASYLRSAFERHALDALQGGDGVDRPSSTVFAVLHQLRQGRRQVRDMMAAAELDSFGTADLTEGNESHVMFIRGHPTPLWLDSIGAKYRIDPEFFLRHLQFRAVVSRPNHFSLPGLPSASVGLMRVRVTTIGYQRRDTPSPDQAIVERRRKYAADKMSTYKESLQREAGWHLADSIVREFSVHDEEHCSIEQDISIYLNRIGQGWHALVWSDCGTDLNIGPQGPWTGPPFDNARWLPNVQYRPDIALRKPQLPPNACLPGAPAIQGIFQSASLLPFAYGCENDKDSLNMCLEHPFFALTELFKFAASSELQFLNLLQAKLNAELDASNLMNQKNPTLSNLLHYQFILERHIDILQQNVVTIKSHANVDAISDKQPDRHDKASAAAGQLLADFEHLLACAIHMRGQCEKGMTIIMNNAMLRESQRAIEQAEKVTKLTQLAFFFIPISFTSSFFGMNFEQFGSSGSLSLWLYFVVSIPVLLLSALFLRWGFVDLTRACRNGLRSIKDLIWSPISGRLERQILERRPAKDVEMETLGSMNTSR